MSVLINMEMPENCSSCYFCTYGFCGNLNRYVKDSARRDSNCPLVELPPHGRLIDADALELASGFDISTEYGLGRYDQVQAVKHNAPTIIPAEEVQE